MKCVCYQQVELQYIVFSVLVTKYVHPQNLHAQDLPLNSKARGYNWSTKASAVFE